MGSWLKIGNVVNGCSLKPACVLTWGISTSAEVMLDDGLVACLDLNDSVSW